MIGKVEPKDERDRLIEARAYRNGYFVLASGAVWGICLGLTGVPNARILLAVLVAAEVATWATQLYLYRRGV